ncbi:MAG: hypothetical protein HOD60_05855 [Candidatus Nitrosopelagicus sp.]|jgi:hypothetical protein|nr:hypothetical protein [Candidatus Nitrosopelagicus sp.]
MNSTTNRSQNRFTFDTCVGIKAFESPNVGSLLACRVNFDGSEIHLSSQSVFEAKRLGFDVDAISEQIQTSTGARITFGKITTEMYDDAYYLEGVCPTLHSGDSQILAYVRATGTILITCDRGLVQAAMLCGVSVINPDLLPCDQIARKVKSKYSGIVRKVIRKPQIVKHKVKKFALKPGQKIVWRSFV